MTSNSRKVVLVLFISVATLTLPSISHISPSKGGLWESDAAVFFDLNNIDPRNRSQDPVSYPVEMTFADIVQNIVSSYAKFSVPQQFMFTHKDFSKNVYPVNHESTDYELTPAKLGFKGYGSVLDQPGGPIKVVMGYKVMLKVGKGQMTSYVFDLEKEVGTWIEGIINAKHEVGSLYVNSKLISPREKLGNAFSSMIYKYNFDIIGDIVIRIAVDSEIIDGNGSKRIIKISQTDTLESILKYLDLVIPDADPLNKKMLCLTPTCDKNITEMAAPFSNYEPTDYLTLYIPGPITILAIVPASGKSSKITLERSTTLYKFTDIIRDTFFQGDDRAHLIIHSLSAHEDAIIDSERIEEYKNTYLVNLGIYSFKVTEEESSNCNIEIKTKLTHLVKDSFKGSYPCSATIIDISLSAHKFFSSSYSSRLYDNDAQLMKYPPGVIMPVYIASDKLDEDLLYLPISAFKESDSGAIIFSYTYQIVLKKHFKETEYFTYPLTVSASTLASQIMIERGSIHHDNNAMPLLGAPIPSEHYYARVGDLLSQGERDFLSLYTPAVPALYYEVYDEETFQFLVFEGQYQNHDKIAASFTFDMQKKDVEMLARRRLVDRGGDYWKRGEEGVDVEIRYQGKEIEWNEGETWKSVRDRVIGMYGQTLTVIVTLKNNTLKLQQRLKIQ